MRQLRDIEPVHAELGDDQLTFETLVDPNPRLHPLKQPVAANRS